MGRFAVFVIAWLTLAAAASAQDWEDRIAAARAKTAAVEAYGAAYGWDYGMTGTFTRKADVATIRCQVLAEMIGLGDISGYLEFYGPDPTQALELPPIDVPVGDGIQLLMMHGWNIGLWATTAEQSLGYTDDQRAETWEVYCTGKNGIPEGLVPAAWDRRASFRIDGSRLYVMGDIEPGFYEDFVDALAGNDVGIVMLGSRGGSVEDAMQAGALIRRLGLAVELFGDCESACPLMYFSGVAPRAQQLPLHRLGFHQISVGGVAIPLDHEIYEVVAAFIDAMGVDSDYILTAMQDTPPESMYYPPYQWLCDANAGWFYGNCTQPHPWGR